MKLFRDGWMNLQRMTALLIRNSFSNGSLLRCETVKLFIGHICIMSKKIALEALLKGGVLLLMMPGRYTVNDRKNRPVVRLSQSEALHLTGVCKKKRSKFGAYWIIDRRSLQRLHGNDWRYKVYRTFLKKQRYCQPSGFEIIESPYKKSAHGKNQSRVNLPA